MILALLLAALPAQASPAPDRATPSAALVEARAASASGDQRRAIEVLKAAADAYPDSEAVATALAQAYLADDNATWATRVLNQFLERHPDACHARLLLAWTQIGEALPELARDTIGSAQCSTPPELNARKLLVLTYLAHIEQSPARVRRLLRQVRKSRALYAEDRQLLADLSARYEPGRESPVVGDVQWAAGWTSNGLAGSPVDLASPGNPGSPVTIFDARLQLTLPAATRIHGVLDGELRAQRLWDPAVEELSFRHGKARAGILVGGRSTRVLAAFAAETTQLRGGDLYDVGPVWFAEAQRGEVELQQGSLFSVTGAGWRRFRERVRSRFEVDETVGWSVVGWRGIRATAGASLRYHDAEHAAHDLVGASVLSQVRVPVVAGSALTGTAATAFDAYPHSRGYFAGSGRAKRHDGQLRLRAGVWSPRLAGVLLGATYEWATRRSSAQDYDFDDHRVLGHLEWRFDADTLGRRILTEGERPRFDYGTLGPADSGATSEIRELMRRDEAANQGASCAR